MAIHFCDCQAIPFPIKIKKFASVARKFKQFCKQCQASLLSLFFHLSSFWSLYFATVSLLGYLVLRISNPKATSMKPRDIDIFFMSVSAATVSSMATIEMEYFSNAQLIMMTVLMLVGGEVFTSMLALPFQSSEFGKPITSDHDITLSENELPSIMLTRVENKKFPAIASDIEHNINGMGNDNLKGNAYKCLCYVVVGYFLVLHLVGSTLVALYISFTSTAREVLNQKDLNIQTFSVFTLVSTFANCGFVPTNENMIVFKKNSGLLLLLIPQILLGNTLYAPCLRFLIWVLGKITKREEFGYILMNAREMGYSHLLSCFHSFLIVVAVLGFMLVQFVLFYSMKWNSEVMAGLSLYEKLAAAFFQVVNSRHAGESVFDLSALTPAFSVLVVVMMYLPAYTSFLPIKHPEEEGKDVSSRKKEKSKNQWKTLVQDMVFSHLSHLVIFIILICITERDKMKNDPLNFNALNVTFEVISAYGNVGFSTGYSCKRKLNKESSCTDGWYGFAGKWSNEGKLILIIVMFYGRLKKFNMQDGKAWKLS